ncbi:unnamed protein product [Acanthoscelides obtectus]|uniref:Uncharacterized protein n=1 Tax=Acanthoscelides obtectus TaxID=200917 RepID=A0A9P0L707_ACAOB|nr:unnamed protein product [Acanthoscelides obtectus]CAK1623393.1 hypothetical protein AOBTE_LOCUS1979 [Acanthoscelides obtectus]
MIWRSVLLSTVKTFWINFFDACIHIQNIQFTQTF